MKLIFPKIRFDARMQSVEFLEIRTVLVSSKKKKKKKVGKVGILLIRAVLIINSMERMSVCFMGIAAGIIQQLQFFFYY